MGYFKENGKTFYNWGNGSFTRAHDESFSGARFSYKRCPKCGKLICSHIANWIKHTEKCQKNTSTGATV